MGYYIKGDRAHKENPPHELDKSQCRYVSEIPSGIEKCDNCWTELPR